MKFVAVTAVISVSLVTGCVYGVVQNHNSIAEIISRCRADGHNYVLLSGTAACVDKASGYVFVPQPNPEPQKTDQEAPETFFESAKEWLGKCVGEFIAWIGSVLSYAKESVEKNLVDPRSSGRIPSSDS